MLANPFFGRESHITFAEKIKYIVAPVKTLLDFCIISREI